MKNIHSFDKSLLEDGEIAIRQKHGDTSFYLHRHDYYEIMFYERCRGVCTLNGIEFELDEDCLFFLTPLDFHRIDAKVSEGATSINISFSEKLISGRLAKELSFSPRIWRGAPRRFVAELNNILDCYRENPKGETKLYYMLNSILWEIAEKGDKIESEGSCIRPMIRQVMASVNSDIAKDISLEKISKSCGVNPTYFSEIFRKETGRGFKAWLTSCRIEYAKRLLEDGDDKTIDIGFASGYNTPSQFIKMFKKETGMTPSEYRQSVVGRAGAQDSQKKS